MTATILVVEDNEDNIELAQFLLKAFGYPTLLAKNGAEGVRVASEERPDLILMDIEMPVMDGFEATRAIKAKPELSEIPIIAVTAYARVYDTERIMASGFDGYITKPISPHGFIGEIEGFISELSPGQA